MKRKLRLDLSWPLLREMLGLPEDAELTYFGSDVFAEGIQRQGPIIGLRFITEDPLFTENANPETGAVELVLTRHSFALCERCEKVRDEGIPEGAIKELWHRGAYLTEVRPG